MKDGTNDTPLSAVKQVSKLAVGEAYCKAVFISAIQYSPDRIREAKEALMHGPEQSLSEIRQLPINVGFILVTLGLIWGFVGGYYFYNERSLIASGIFGSALLFILLGAWFHLLT